MRASRSLRTLLLTLALAAFAAPAGAAVIFVESVPGGTLARPWLNGFGVSSTIVGTTLDPSHPAWANPSGDHTVGVATTSIAPDSGGVVLAATDPGLTGADYTWEGWMFTGEGNSRRGLVVRADPSNGFQTCYQFVIQSGLFQINFRRLVNSAPSTLGTWFANTLTGGVPQPNTWHHLKVIAQGNEFRCFWDGQELTTTPIVDSTIPTGWVGVYNFRFDLGNIPAQFDDLTLTSDLPVPVNNTSWGAVKGLYRK